MIRHFGRHLQDDVLEKPNVVVTIGMHLGQCCVEFVVVFTGDGHLDLGELFGIGGLYCRKCLDVGSLQVGQFLVGFGLQVLNSLLAIQLGLSYQLGAFQFEQRDGFFLFEVELTLEALKLLLASGKNIKIKFA